MRFTKQIGKITQTGQFTFYTIPGTAEQITRGPGNNPLFTTRQQQGGVDHHGWHSH